MCGKISHTSLSCCSMKISKIQRLAVEESNIKAAKLERKHIVKIKKKKMKKHKENVEGMNRVVTMKILINNDEDIRLE